MKIKLLFYSTLSGFLIIEIYFFFLFFSLFKNYDALIQFLSPYLNSEQQLYKLKNHFLTPYRFEILRIFVPFVLLMLLISNWAIYKNRLKIITYLNNQILKYQLLTKQVYHLFQTLTQTQILILITIIFIINGLRFFWSLKYPLTYDELYIWEEFVQRGFLVSASYYPIHGNHIFQTLLVNFFSFLEPTYALRLPTVLFAFLMDICIWIYFYYRTKSFYSSLTILLIIDFFYVNWIHSFMGRGYQLGLLLSWIILIFYERKWISSFFYELILLQVLLIYTLPSGLFFLIPFWTLYWFEERKTTVINVLWTCILTTFLYTPVLFFLNYQSLFSGAYYHSLSIHEKLIFFNQIWQFPDIWHIPTFIGIILSLIFMIFTFQQKKFIYTVFFLYLLLTTLIGLFTSFPAKAFMPLTFLIGFLIISIHFNSLKFVILTIVIALLYISNIQEFENQFQKHFEAHRFALEVYRQLPFNLKLKLNLSPYDDSDLYFLNLKHVYRKNGNSITIENHPQNNLILVSNQLPINKKINGKILHKDSNMQLIKKIK